MGKCRITRHPFNGQAHGGRNLFTHYFNDDAFLALAVEFGIVNLLPGAEIELTGGHGNDHLVVHQEAFQMRIAIRLSSPVMAIVVTVWSELFQPFVDVGQQAVFGVIYPDSSGYVHGRHQDHALLDSALD